MRRGKARVRPGWAGVVVVAGVVMGAVGRHSDGNRIALPGLVV